MVIQCPQCQTRFKLPDDKMKPEGIKVRCAKCQHIFMAVPPAPEPEPEEADTASDFGFGDLDQDDLPPKAPAASLQKAPPAEEEESWVDFGGIQQEEEPSFEGLGDLKSSISTEDERDFSFDGDIFEEPEEKPADVQAEAFDFSFSEGVSQSDEFSLEDLENAPRTEEADDFEGTMFPMEEKEVPRPPAHPKGLEEFEEFSFDEKPRTDQKPEFEFDSGESDWSAEAFDAPQEKPDFEGKTFETEDFGFDDEGPAPIRNEFDFQSEASNGSLSEGLESSGMSFAEPAPASPLVAAEPQREAPREEPRPLAPVAPLPEVPTSAGEKPPGIKGPIKKEPSPTQKSSRLLLTVLLVLLMGICGAAGYLFWTGDTPELSRLIEQFTGQTGGNRETPRIGIGNLNGKFMNNREVGSIFVITGQATNNYEQSRSALAVKGVLYDDKGKPALEQTAFCGNPLSDKELETLPFAKILEKTDNQFGDSLSNLNLGPGKSIPFAIVFRNVPSSVSEFTVVATESIPGTR